jgi:TonB-linked SusC/RagA family outer membrane protein
MNSQHRYRALWGLAAGVALAFFASTPLAAQQGGIVEGTVTDADGRPVGGAQVSIVDSQRGTITNAQGTYRITGVQAGTREVRAQRIGYRTATQTVSVTAGETVALNFTMQQAVVDVDEVIVTGVAGETARAKLPFTVDRLDAEALPVPAISAGSAIQGKVAGAQVVAGSGRPGSAPSILLRGPTSINAQGRSQEPLYIVDGVILGASVADIDALDIESIEVVKGAAAASLYGSRAANGVIQITTRTGRFVADDATRFSFRSELGQSSLAGDFPLARNHRFRLNADGTRFVSADGTEFVWEEEARQWQRRNINPETGHHQVDTSQRAPYMPVATGTNIWNTFQNQVWPGETHDHVATFFDPGTFMTNSLSVEGRSGATNYHASLSQTSEDGIITGQRGYDRQAFRVNLDQGIGDNFTISTRTYYSRSEQDGQNIEAGGGSPLFNLTRQPAGVRLDATMPAAEGGSLLIRPDYVEENANPLYELINMDRTDERQRFLAGANLRWSPLAFLDLDGNVSYDRSDVSRSQYAFRGFITARPNATLNPGYLFRDGWLNEALNTSATATFRQRFGELNTRTQLRYLYEAEHYDFFRASGTHQQAENIRSLRAFTNNRTVDSSIQDVRSEGYFLITNFDFRDRYILDALVRRDGSSLFGPDDRWHTYYRGAAAWRLSEEPWWTLPALNEFKLRYSIGTAGGRPNFAAQYETYNVSLAGSMSPQTLGNRELRPEHATEQEVGLEVIAMDRVAFNLTYATTTAEHQILPVPLPAFAGFGTQWQNAGTLQSNTWEASIESPIIQTPDFTWSSRILFDRTRQEITEIGVAPFQYGFPQQGLENVFWLREGESLGTFYGRRWATSCADLPANMQNVCQAEFDVNDDGYLVWVGQNNTWRSGQWGEAGPTVDNVGGLMWGVPFAAQDADGETFLPIGSTQPDFNLSFANTINFRNFSLYGLLDATQGVHVYNLPRHWSYFQNYSRDQDQAHKPENEQKPVGYYGPSGLYHQLGPANSHFVEDGSFVKLREVSARYRFAGEQLSGLPLLQMFDGVALSLVGRNLFTWTNYSGYDPEVGLTGGTLGSAAISRFDGFTYPNFRTFTAAIEVTF